MLGGLEGTKKLKKSQHKEKKPKNKDAPWLIKANYWVAGVIARFLGILGTKFGGIARQKNLKKYNPKQEKFEKNILPD